eukprot:3909153-Pleurochrysis_carterae.AAC.1
MRTCVREVHPYAAHTSIGAYVNGCSTAFKYSRSAEQGNQQSAHATCIDHGKLSVRKARTLYRAYGGMYEDDDGSHDASLAPQGWES